MVFEEAVMAYYKGYFDFSGRASRSDYWLSMLYQTVVAGLLYVPLVVFFLYFEISDTSGSQWLLALLILPMMLFSLSCLIPNIAIGVRRFHDLGLPAWVFAAVIFSLFVPYANFVGALMWISAMCIRGSTDENRYGQSPLYKRKNYSSLGLYEAHS